MTVEQMEEKELDIKDIIEFMNQHEGEFFIRLILNEEGELRGETDGCCVSETC